MSIPLYRLAKSRLFLVVGTTIQGRLLEASHDTDALVDLDGKRTHFSSHTEVVPLAGHGLPRRRGTGHFAR